MPRAAEPGRETSRLSASLLSELQEIRGYRPDPRGKTPQYRGLATPRNNPTSQGSSSEPRPDLVERARHGGDTIGMTRRHVTRLTRIAAQVVQLRHAVVAELGVRVLVDLLFGVGLDVLPLALRRWKWARFFA